MNNTVEDLVIAEIAANLCIRFPGQINTATALNLAAIPQSDREQIITRARALQQGRPTLSLDDLIPVALGALVGELIIEGI